MRPAPLRDRLATVGTALRGQSVLRERAGWSRDALEAHQRERLRAMVRHASVRSAFYRERFAEAGVNAARDVAVGDLPVVRKDELMERFDDWVTDPRLRREAVERHLHALAGDELLFGEHRVMATGGSTGSRGVFVFSRAEWRELCVYFMAMFRAAGLTPKVPRRKIASIAAPSPAHMTWRLSSSLDIGLHRRLPLAATMPIDELVEALNRFEPEGFNSYPSVAAMLAEEQLEGRLRISPEHIAVSSELCTPEMRDRIRAAWGVEPFEVYGATDGLWGWHCEHHRLHFAEDITIVEVEDERLLVTNLFMKTQPVIRYEITDIVRLGAGPCPCGRPTRWVEAIEGRSDDILELMADGGGTARVHPIKLRSPLAQLGSVRQYQAVLRDDGLHVAVVPRGDAARARDEVRAALAGALRDAGAVAPVHVETVAALTRDSGTVGKLKLVRSELSSGGQATASMFSRT
jgi:phenylacetate-coenzyme A ligase PaaK-like adenylate-forming protein